MAGGKVDFVEKLEHLVGLSVDILAIGVYILFERGTLSTRYHIGRNL
jgi:hypothetical protein